jgi:anti-sigma factor RsiW
MTSSAYHPTEDRLEAFVEGTLERAERVVVESHLLSCAACQGHVDEWRALFAALSDLPQFEPSAAFADRVMAGVRVAPLALSRRPAWQQAWAAFSGQAGAAAAAAAAAAGRLAPQTTRGWAIAAVALALPVAASAVLLAWLATSSYLSPGLLWAFATTQAADWLRAAGTAAATALLQTDVAAWLVAQLGTLLRNAGAAGLGALFAAGGGATMLSVWVLYRYLFRTPTRESHHVTYSF